MIILMLSRPRGWWVCPAELYEKSAGMFITCAKKPSMDLEFGSCTLPAEGNGDARAVRQLRAAVYIHAH